MVLLFHFGLLDMGWMGVEIFFVLSGYLITSILSKGRKWPLGFYLKRFYWRRVLRIFPAYFGLIGIFALLFVITGHPGKTDEALPYLLSYTLNIFMFVQDHPPVLLFDYLWSLSFEEQFYVFWPLLVFFLNRRGFTVLCLAIIALSPLARHLLADYLIEQRGTQEYVGGMIYYFPLGQLDTFATGALLAVLPWKDYIKRPLRLFTGVFSVFVGAGLICMALFFPDSPLFVMSNFGYPVSSLVYGQHIWSYSLINLTAGALILVAVVQDARAGGWLRKVLESRALVQLGKVSYGLYLLHWPIQMVFERFMALEQNLILRFLQFLPFFALAWGASWISFRYFESWFLRKKTNKFNEPPTPISNSTS